MSKGSPQHWIFSVRYWSDEMPQMQRCAVVGPARASTVEAALHLAKVPEIVRAAIRADETVRQFVEGALDPDKSGYYLPCPFPVARTWMVCIGSVQAVLTDQEQTREN